MSWSSQRPTIPLAVRWPGRRWPRVLAGLVLAGLGLAWLGLAGGQRASGPGAVRGYIGPGAGIALFGSFLTVLIAVCSGVLALIFWPLRLFWRLVRGRKAYARARVRRVVVLGLDGLEPELTEKYLEQGRLPNLEKLRARGSYLRLGTTWPPLSPVAWSSFSTGTNPGKHNIFDFLARNPADYRPTMSSVRIREPRRKLRLGRYLLALARPEITSLRKSKPFWSVLGEAGVFSAVLRVPISFPPDRFRGVQLAAMCLPDLRGTQGSFTHYVEPAAARVAGEGAAGQQRVVVRRSGGAVESYLRGPPNSLRAGRPEMRVPFKVVGGRDGAAMLHADGQRIALQAGCYSPWVTVAFPAAPGFKVRGVCRFLLKRFETPFEMYCTPVQIDPRRPVMPISHPRSYATYLACRQGTFATLGLAEDTRALSEGVLSEEEFLAQVYDIQRERERMLFDALRRVRRGLLVCVFDAPDRVQHMFWRFIDDGHPARRGRGGEAQRQAIGALYARMDALVGRVLDELDQRSALLVMSDHGFKPFRRGVDLNAWLLANGYLKLKGGARSSDRAYLADVDWSATRAYALGLAGIYLNRRGREGRGIVAAAESGRLLRQLKRRLSGLRDPEAGQVAIREAVIREEVYRGPYVENAPDLIIGYNPGYRVAWAAAVGKCGAAVFADNARAWSGDHGVHPELVPGVLFSNLKLTAAGANIIDLAPSILELFGVQQPEYMDGKSLLCGVCGTSA